MRNPLLRRVLLCSGPFGILLGLAAPVLGNHFTTTTVYEAPVATSYVLSTSYALPTSYVVPTSYVLPTSYVVPTSYALPTSYVVPTSYVLPTSYVVPTSYVTPTVYTTTSFLTPTYYDLLPTSYVLPTSTVTYSYRRSLLPWRRRSTATSYSYLPTVYAPTVSYALTYYDVPVVASSSPVCCDTVTSASSAAVSSGARRSSDAAAERAPAPYLESTPPNEPSNVQQGTPSRVETPPQAQTSPPPPTPVVPSTPGGATNANEPPPPAAPMPETLPPPNPPGTGTTPPPGTANPPGDASASQAGFHQVQGPALLCERPAEHREHGSPGRPGRTSPLGSDGTDGGRRQDHDREPPTVVCGSSGNDRRLWTLCHPSARRRLDDIRVSMPSGRSYDVSQITVSGGQITDDLARQVPSLTITR